MDGNNAEYILSQEVTHAYSTKLNVLIQIPESCPKPANWKVFALKAIPEQSILHVAIPNS